MLSGVPDGSSGWHRLTVLQQRTLSKPAQAKGANSRPARHPCDMNIHKRKATSASIRLQIAWRQDWKCNECADTLHWTFEVDHIVALFDGGSNDYTNLQALCVKCHKTKSMRERGCAPETVLLATHKRCDACHVVYSLYFKHECRPSALCE